MSRTPGPRRLTLALIALTLLLTPLLAVSRPQPAAAAGVVTECTEAALRAALEGGGLVTFDGCGTITLSSQLEITADTTIDGGGVVTLDGANATWLIQVHAGVDLTLRGLTLQGGLGSNNGAIENNGTLIISASTFTNNSAVNGGAIFNTGTSIITASTFTNNSADVGGAIDNNGPSSSVTISASTFANNTADRGGAINNDLFETLTITASTFTNNTAVADGGAIDNDGTLIITASTFAGNAAVEGGGAVSNDPTGTLAVSASTFADNTAGTGGAIHSLAFEDATLTASILSGSENCAGAIVSGGYNVTSDASCNLTATTDLQNTEPQLGSLQDNGGPTQTILPDAESPAIDRVPSTVCATLSAANDGRDQRGAIRPVGDSACDSGSVEVGASVPPVWLLAAYAVPQTLLPGQSATIIASAIGAPGTAPEYTFGCPEDEVGPQPEPQASCAFPTPGAIVVPVSVAPAGAPADADQGSVTVTVIDPTPVVELTPATASIAEGGSYVGTASFSAVGSGPWEATLDSGDGTPQDVDSVAPGQSFDVSLQYLSSGTYSLTVTVCDTSFNACGQAQATVTVSAVAPSVTITPDSLQLIQGETFQASGAFSDLGAGPWTATVDYGDGDGPQPLPFDPVTLSFNLIHVYLAQGDFPVTVVVCDASDACGEASVTVQVGNAAPVIDEILRDVEGSQVVVTVTASDPGGGPLTYRFECAGGVIGPQPSPTAFCDYGHQAGQFPILVEVTDSDGVSVRQAVVVELVSYFCAAERSGAVTFHTQPGCERYEQQVRLDAASTLAFCVGERSGAMQYVGMAPAGCQRGEFALLLPHDGPVTICVGERSRLARYVADAGECNPRGELVYVIANRVIR